MVKNIVNIKGTAEGLIFSFNPEDAGFSQLLSVLREKLAGSGDFFTNATYYIDQPTQFTPEELAEIEQVLAKYHLTRGKVQPHQLLSDDRFDTVYQTRGGNSLLVTKGIRSGQRFAVRGHIIVMGDINPGGEVVATGNIVVMGLCRGVLHAGAEGDEKAYIVVYGMEAQQLRIASYVATVPASAGETPNKLALVREGEIVLTDYLPAQLPELLGRHEEGDS